MPKRTLRFPLNTHRRGRVTVLVYRPSKERLYTGACLELDIVDQHEDPDFLQRSLTEAAKGYVESVIEKNQPEELLNRPAPAEFWMVYRELQRIEEEPSREVSLMRLAILPYPADSFSSQVSSHVPTRV